MVNASVVFDLKNIENHLEISEMYFFRDHEIHIESLDASYTLGHECGLSVGIFESVRRQNTHKSENNNNLGWQQ